MNFDESARVSCSHRLSQGKARRQRQMLGMQETEASPPQNMWPAWSDNTLEPTVTPILSLNTDTITTRHGPVWLPSQPHPISEGACSGDKRTWPWERKQETGTGPAMVSPSLLLTRLVLGDCNVVTTHGGMK